MNSEVATILISRGARLVLAVILVLFLCKLARRIIAPPTESCPTVAVFVVCMRPLFRGAIG